MICFYDSKGIIHKEFVPTVQTVNAVFYVGVLKRLVSRIRRIRPEDREEGSWRLLHDTDLKSKFKVSNMGVNFI